VANSTHLAWCHNSQSYTKPIGKGLYSRREIKKGEWIAFYTGEILTKEEKDKRCNDNLTKYIVNFPHMIIDACSSRCYASYANDWRNLMSKVTSQFPNSVPGVLNANLAYIYRNRNCPDKYGGIEANDDIPAHTEILIFYGDGYDFD
jgi:hypothetical protein